MTDGPTETRGATAGSCPRCAGPVWLTGRAPAPAECQRHGAVYPLQPAALPGVEPIRQLLTRAEVPAWLPWPLPENWLVTGAVDAVDASGAGRAVAVACSGPNPCDAGPADLVLVAEEPGIGLGAGFAGLDGPDAGTRPIRGAPHAKLTVGGHPAPLWCVPGSPGAADRAVFVGEALGRWLWAVLWPASAGHLMYDSLNLTDLRELGEEVRMLPFGAVSPRLVG